jgi:hypothetical protein
VEELFPGEEGGNVLKFLQCGGLTKSFHNVTAIQLFNFFGYYIKPWIVIMDKAFYLDLHGRREGRNLSFKINNS